MKTKLLLLSTSILAANAAMAEVDFYGKAYVSLQAIESKENGEVTQDNVELVSNASRVGVKASTDINDSLQAIAQLEYEVYFDDGSNTAKSFEQDINTEGGDTETISSSDTSALKQRNSFVGLKGNFGSVIAGIHDTPTKMIGKPVDIFSDLTFADIKNLVEGENRQKNMIMYRSPSWGGVKVNAMFAPGEDDGINQGDRDGIADAISASVSYAIDNFSLAASYDSDVDDQDLIRLVGAFNHDAFGASLMLQQAEEVVGTIEEDGIIATAHYKLGSWKLKALYGMATESADGAEDLDKTQLVLAADYKLTKSAKVFGYVAQVDKERSGVDVAEDQTLGFGMEYKF